MHAKKYSKFWFKLTQLCFSRICAPYLHSLFALTARHELATPKLIDNPTQKNLRKGKRELGWSTQQALSVINHLHPFHAQLFKNTKYSRY